MPVLAVISPHPDDIELGCGGYIAKRIAQGWAVHCLVLATGDVYFRHVKRVVTEEERRQECLNGLAVLGVDPKDVLFPLSQMDTKLDTMPRAKLVSVIEAWLRTVQPEEVLFPLSSSHQDHEAVYKASVSACRPSALGPEVKLVAAYEYTGSSWGEGGGCDSGTGGLYVDVGKDMPLKIKALKQHKSQIRDGHCWSTEAMQSLARLRGMEAGVEFAEKFHVMREWR